MKKLPLGIQTFSEIIEENYLYIDKTKHILDLVSNNKYVFLSRPRRFGKSLLVSTLKELYEGNKKLFKELYIYNKWDWKTKYPIITISLTNIGYKDQGIGLQTALENQIISIGKSYNIELNSKGYTSTFRELIQKLGKVVILIDEYDKPIIDYLDNPNEANKNKDILKEFYVVIKENDAFIKFAFLTGVTKFSKVSVFSGLNNLKDISLSEQFGSICGYTQNDIETYFKPYLEGVNLEDLKTWYNGYNFLGEKVYNPYCILSFFNNNKKYNNYWFETGTPTYLIELIKKNKYFIPNLENLEVDESFINSFDIDHISLETILFQAGYLTIKEEFREFNKSYYKLEFPNREVKISFYSYILNLFVDKNEQTVLSRGAIKVLLTSDLDELKPLLVKVFANIPYHNYTNNFIANYEGFYASVIHTYFASLGLNIIAEDVTNKGRIDLTLIIENKTYIFEFKTTNEDPLKQIKEKKYYEKYSGEIYIIGIVFDPKERNLKTLKWEKI